MTPQPTDVTEIGLEAYHTVKPLAKEDERNGWALLRFVDAVVSQAQTVRDQVRDRSAIELGYSILMDVNRAPAYALEWLSQFAGVDLTKVQRGVNVLLRNEFNNPSFEYDAVAGAAVGWSSAANGGITAVISEVSEGWSAVSRKSYRSAGTKANNAVREGVGLIQKTGSANYIPVQPGKFLTVQQKINTIKASELGYSLIVDWFRADGTTELPSSSINGINPEVVGVRTTTNSFLVPEHAAFARVRLISVSEVALREMDFFCDEFMGLLSETEPPAGPIEYADGDQKECQWVGPPGDSASIKVSEMTEEQYNELKRSRIKELPGTKRGTPGAIITAAKQYLIGDKTVLMQERPGGNPWRLVIITFSEETTNEAAVKQAIEEQLPAGIVLEYNAVPITDWLVIRTEYKTWLEVKEAFVTWGGVRLNNPGT
jgi:hypothetical protein